MFAGRKGCDVAKTACVTTLRLVRILCLCAMPILVLDLLLFGFVCQGVRSAVPAYVRAESLAHYEERLDVDQVTLLESSYSGPNSSGVRIFVGHPTQLSTLSPLSLAFCSCAGGEGLLQIAEGLRQVKEEYAELGISPSSLRDAYVVRSARDLLSCSFVLLSDCAVLWSWGSKCGGLGEKGLLSAMEHMLKVG